jgi:hypothetical protein
MHKSHLGANYYPPLFFLCWVWFDPKPIWEQNNWLNLNQNSHFYTHATFLAGKWHKSSPPFTPLTPNSLILCRRVAFMYRNHWVTPDVQFRKGALIPSFWVGLGWADFMVDRQPNTVGIPIKKRHTITMEQKRTR